MSPDFLSGNANPDGSVGVYGNVGKVVVHEWAKMRWGVFEEHGYPGDEQFPLFYFKVNFISFYVFFLSTFYNQ